MKTTNHLNQILLGLCFWGIVGGISAQQVNNLLYDTLQISNRIYVLVIEKSNITVLKGENGILVIDTGHKWYANTTDSLLKTFSGVPVKYILNTHFHFDHVGGDSLLRGDDGIILAQENTRSHLISSWNPPPLAGIKYPDLPPYSEAFIPNICFSESMKVYFGNEIIHCIHLPNAHTDGDAAYFMENANVLVSGDVFVSNGLPIIGYTDGGSIDGTIKAIDKLLAIINEHTVIIPGHGPLANKQDLQNYKQLLITGRNRIATLLEAGKTVDEIIDAAPLTDLLKDGKSWIPQKIFIYTVYKDISEK